MWELFLKWLPMFGWIFGGSCLLCSLMMGWHRSIKDIFGVSSDLLLGDDPRIGIFPASAVSVIIFSFCGWIFWLTLTVIFDGSGKSILAGLIMNGVLGCAYVLLERRLGEVIPEQCARLITALIGGGNGGMFLGVMMINMFAEEINDTEKLMLGVLLCGSLGGLAGGVTGGFLSENRKIISSILEIFSKSSNNSLDDIPGGSFFEGWIVGITAGTIVASCLTCAIGSGFAWGIWAGLLGGILMGMVAAIAICMFLMPIGLIFGGLLGIPLAIMAFLGITGTQLVIGKIAKLLSWLINPFLILLKFHTIICNVCLCYTRPLKSVYENGTRFCEHCRQKVEYTKDPGKVLLVFGNFGDIQLQKLKSGN